MRKTKTIAIATSILTLISASAVFAATTSNTTVSVPKFSQTRSGGIDGSFQNRLDSLLKAGTITQVQEDAVQAALKTTMTITKGEAHNGPQGGLQALVTAGTITQTQADAITAAMTTAVKGPDGVKTALDALVKAGTITQVQADAVTPHKGDMNRGDAKGPQAGLKELVTAGTITQTQADAITAAMTTAVKGPDGVKTALDALVTAGTITQDQADAVTPHKGDMNRGYAKGPQGGLQALVTAGTITQTQADAITAAMTTAVKGPDGVKTALDA
ncbi:hypothetical protein, partial [Desulfosporosinus sp. Sb-LF]|uniref:hypothetical protein n=1 Tax=Desulfosporosinus sp. Sb-LF TaxID=2560027 RepID=UPI00107FA575